MSSSANDLNLDQECLRLASDLMQLSRDSLNPDLQAHCVRLANHWADRAVGSPKTDVASAGDLEK